MRGTPGLGGPSGSAHLEGSDNPPPTTTPTIPTSPFTYIQLNVCTLADTDDPHRNEPEGDETRAILYCNMFHTYDFICLQETRICGMVRKNEFQGYTA